MCVAACTLAVGYTPPAVATASAHGTMDIGAAVSFGFMADGHQCGWSKRLWHDDAATLLKFLRLALPAPRLLKTQEEAEAFHLGIRFRRLRRRRRLLQPFRASLTHRGGRASISLPAWDQPAGWQ